MRIGKVQSHGAAALMALLVGLVGACAATPDAPSADRAPPPPAAAEAAPAPPASAAPDAASPPPEAAADAGSDEPTVTVPAPQKPLPKLADPRTPAQRMDDIRAWDQCVLGVQRRDEMDTRTNPVSDTPEEYCRKRLGMTSRTSIPASRER